MENAQTTTRLMADHIRERLVDDLLTNMWIEAYEGNLSGKDANSDSEEYNACLLAAVQLTWDADDAEGVRHDDHEEEWRDSAAYHSYRSYLVALYDEALVDEWRDVFIPW